MRVYTIFSQPDCPLCNGRGVVQIEAPTSTYRYCRCYVESFVREVIKKAPIPRKFREATVNGFDPRTESEKQAKITIRDWVEGYNPKDPSQNQSLVLRGGVGPGKTHLACAILLAVAKKHQEWSAFRPVPDMMTDIRKRLKIRNNPLDEDEDPVEPLKTTRLLCLDDLGAEYTTPYSIDTICEIIDARYRNGLPLIITTNLEFEQLRQLYGDRTVDRIHGTSIELHLDGPSRRPSEPQKAASSRASGGKRR